MLSDQLPLAGPQRSWLQTAHALPAVVLIAGALISSLSPLQFPWFFPVWLVVFAAAALAAGWQGGKRLRFPPIQRFVLNDLALLALIAAGTTQAIAAVDLPSPFQKIHATPGIASLYVVLAGLLAAVTVRVALRYGSAGRLGAALLGACLFSSTFYLRAHVVGEAGLGYGVVFAFLAAAWLIGGGTLLAALRKGDTRFFWGAALAFLLLLLLSACLSPAPGDSLPYWLRLAVTLGLSAVTAVTVARYPGIKPWLVWAVILLAGAVPVLLTLVKIITLTAAIDWAAALSYRLHLTEFGGGNLFARLVLIAVPLALYQFLLAWRAHAGRWLKIGLGVLLVGMVFAVFQSLSFEGKFALAVAVSLFAVLAGWPFWRRYAARWLNAWPKRLLLAAVLLAAGAALAVLVYRYAPEVNVASFNGRQIHWKAALLVWRDHPLLGGGPGNAMLYTPYYNPDQLGVVYVNQQILDDPLFANDLPKRLTDHAHNLLLEIVSSAGTLGLLAFIAVLVELVRVGLKRWQTAPSTGQWLLAACLAGIAGELAWGVLDVLRVIPPFFSFPVWVLVGILMAPPTAARPPAPAPQTRPVWVSVSALVFALALVLLPTLAASYYAAGFLAFQDQQWLAARQSFEWASRFDPLNPKYPEMAGETAVQLGQWDQSQQSLRRALTLRSGYSPYLYRLGWLAWMQNDLDAARSYFERAVQEDPGEIFQKNLYASAALLAANQGLTEEAARSFAKAAQVSPQTQPGAEWLRVINPAGGVDLTLDPAYLGGPSDALRQRIGMQLGVANLLPRQFKRVEQPASSLSYARVLELLQHSAQQEQRPFQASIQSAILYEVSSRAGFEDAAEQALRSFQSLTPNSAYSYRQLAKVAAARNQPAQAFELLTQAVAVSPKDLQSQLQLAQWAMAEQDWARVKEYLTRLTAQIGRDAYDWRLQRTDLHSIWLEYYRARQDGDNAAATLRALLEIRGEPRDFLNLAAAERQKGRHSSADHLCFQAAHEAIRRWTRPYDGLLYDIAGCVAGSPQARVMPQRLSQEVSAAPLAGKVLVGHLYRLIGLPLRALETYQQAEAIRPEEGAVAFFIAETYQVLGNSDQAEHYYRKAAELATYESLPLVKLSQLQKAQQRDQDALESLRKAVELTPGWDEAQMQLANLLLELGDRKTAALHYRMAQEAQSGLSLKTWQDLLSLFPMAERQTGEIGQMYAMSFNIQGMALPVLWMHPTAAASYAIALPSEPKMQFTAQIALAADSWSQPGDGVTFTLRLRPPGGQETVLFEQYVDPKSNPADRTWLPVMADLSAYAGQTVVITLATGPGPANDYQFDWAGWGSPRIERLE